MSWVVDEWKEGLPTKSLQKIQELESQLDKLKKERQQRQFQLESLEAAFQKQKQKVESEKSEVTALKRENQSLIELCDSNEKLKQKITHEHQMKETQVNFLEGQLTASKKQIEKLEQDLKRYKNDLERGQHQQSFNAGDQSVCVTPQKSFAAPITPYKYNDSKYEDLEDKYNKEVEERKRIENELKILQLKVASQASQASSQSAMNHRDIARQQTSSSVFSWQQERTPSRSATSDTTLKRSFAATQSPWEKEETPIRKGFKSESYNRSAADSCNTQMADQLRAQNQDLRSKINEMEMRLQAQERDLKNQLNKFQETQKLLEKTQKELAEKDKTLTKSKDDLARITRQFEQSTDKCQLAEQKLKKVTEELSCQRQNAESARIAVEQKLKEREKENQQELLRQQNVLQNMEQQLNQIKTKLSQESQQAKNDVNAIQAELDKVTHAKRLLENETEELKQKLCRTEKSLQGSQNNEADCKRQLEEAKSAQNAIKSQYDQKSKEVFKLDEEIKTVNQTIRQNQQLVEEMKNKNTVLEKELQSALEKLKEQDSVNLQTLKVSLSTLEKEKEFAQELLKKKEIDIKEITNTLSKIAEESETLKYQLELKDRENKEMSHANSSLFNWKNENEKVISQLANEKEELLKKTAYLDNSLQSHQEKVEMLETDRNALHTQIKSLQNILDAKTADLQSEKNAYNELLRSLDTADQKFKSENENLVLKISELQAQIVEQKSSISADQISHLEQALQKEKLVNSELQRQCEDLLRAKMDAQKRLMDGEEDHERFVAESRGQVESLQSNIASKQNYVESIESIIKVKEEEIAVLSDKLRQQDTDMQSSHQCNNKLNDKLQELNLHSESWSIERETLTTLISSNQKDIESLTTENKRINEINHSLNYEKTQLLKTNTDLSHIIEEREKNIIEMTERNKEETQILLNGCRTESEKGYENLKQEIVNLKEKQYSMQQENEQLRKANEELTTLINALQNNELSLNKTIEELRASLKETDSASNKMHIQLEMLQMDLDDKEVDMGNINDQVVKLQDALKEAEDSVVKSKVERERAQEVIDVLRRQHEIPDFVTNKFTTEQSFDMDQTEMIQESVSAALLLIGTVDDMNDKNVGCQIKSNQPCNEQKSEQFNAEATPDRESTTSTFGSNCAAVEKIKELESINASLKAENIELLNKLKEMTSKSAVDIKEDESGITEQINIDWQCPDKSVSVTGTEHFLQNHGSPSDVNDRKIDETQNDIKIISEEAADIIFKNTADDLLQMFTETEVKDERELNKSLTNCQTELENLKEQHSIEIAVWQEKLEHQVKEMETKLAAERQQTEHLSFELENARLELQSLDLSSRSLLVFDCEDVTRTFDVPNQSICTVLPIGKLSLDITDLQLDKNGTDPEPSPKCRKECENKETSISNAFNQEEVTKGNDNTDTAQDGGEQSPTSASNSPSRSISETIQDRLNIQTIIDTLKRQVQQTSGDNMKLRQLVEEGERKVNTLLLQIQDLNTKNELTSLENGGTELQNKVQELDNERIQLLDKIELLSNEKLQFSSRVEDLEKELGNISNTMEVLKVQLSEVSRIRDGFEISSGDFKEKYLETANQLRRTKSERDNIEQHALSLEGDLDVLQGKCQHLQEENEGHKNSITALQDRLNIVLAERAQVNQELDTLAEEKEDLDRMYQRLKERERDLESNKISTRELIKILEAELRTLKVELQAAKSLSQQLSLEKDQQMEESGNDAKIEEMQNQLQKVEEEKAVLLKTSEDLQLKLNEAYTEKNELARSLERCQFEKHEMTTRLSSTQEEVALMRTGIEKLKIRIESDEKKKKHMIEKLKDSDRNADNLRDKIENLERELQMSEENLEDAILQTEAAREDAEKLKSLKEALEMDVNTFRRKAVDLEKELQKSNEKMVELEKSLEISEMKPRDLEETPKEILLLQTQLDELEKQKLISDQRYEAAAAMEQYRAELSQQLEEAQNNGVNLQFKVDKLSLELDECKAKLEEKYNLAIILEDKVKDAEQRASKYSAELSHFEAEREALRTEHENLQAMLESKDQVISETNNSFEITIGNLKTLIKDLEIQLEASSTEKSALLHKVQELEENCTGLQCKLEDADLHIKNIQEEISLERKTLNEQMQTVKQQTDESYTQLLAAASEKAEKLVLELDQCKMNLEEKTQCILVLEEKVKNAEQWESKYSAELSHSEAERETLRNERENLQTMLDTLETKVQALSETNGSYEETVTGLKTSCKDLETKLEASSAEKSVLLHKVEELQENCARLKCNLQDADLSIKNIQEEISVERKTLEEQIQTVKQQHEERYAQLIVLTSEKEELKASVTKLQTQLETQAKITAEYQHRQLEVDAAAKQYKDEIEHYQQKLTSTEGHLNAQKHERDCLKASNEELAQTLCNTQKQLVVFNQLKIDVHQLKKENVITCNKLDHWIKSCKQLEQEKELLQNHVKKQEEALKDLGEKQTNASVDTSANDFESEMEELKQSLEEKTLEADESIEKYCTLLIKTNSLEDSNDMLTKQVEFLSSKLKQMETSKELGSVSQTSDTASSTSGRKAAKNRRSTLGTGKQCNKRQRGQEYGAETEGHKPITPQRLPKRMKQVITSDVQEMAEQDAPIEPEGLPDVVKKGFSDIPTGKRSPFVMRRTALPTRTSPRLAAQRNSPSTQALFKDNMENAAEFSSPAAGGSKSQMLNSPMKFGSDTGPMEVASPLSARNRLMETASETPTSAGKVQNERVRPNVNALHEQSESEETCHVQ
ncbi:centromere protein F [Discoglossus pictus]